MSNTSGTIGVIFALTAVPFILAAGAAVDYSRSSSAQAVLQNALDSAALAAGQAKNLDDQERQELAQQIFTANITARGLDVGAVSTNFDLSGEEVEMSASYDVPMVFMQLAGFDNVTVGADVDVTIPKPQPAEIILVLDYSGSMRRRSGSDQRIKYQAMRDAAINLVQGLRTDDEPDLIKFSLVPYGTFTRVTLPEAWVLGQGDSLVETWTGCVLDRNYPFNVNGTIPNPDRDETKWVPASQSCSGFAENNLNSRPLTSEFDEIIDQLVEMEPPQNNNREQFTHIPLGLETALNYISDEATRKGGAPDKEPKQYIILLTDGQQTVSAAGPNGRQEPLTSRNSAGRAQGERNLERLCRTANAKDDLTIVTVAFDLEDQTTEDRLADCASSASEAFVAESGNALEGVFDQIKNQLRRSIFISG